jgi:hypothetical protein
MKTKLANIPWSTASLAAAAVLAILFAAATSLRAASPLPGAIFTTDSTCTGVNVNIYGSKADVYLNGGPAHPGAANLPDGSYYVQVTDPSGACVLGTSGNSTPFVVTGGVANCIKLCEVLTNGPVCPGDPPNTVDSLCGYNDTTNPGGEYKAWVSTVSTFDNDSTKTDNFKVRAGGGDDPADLCVRKFYDADVDGIWDDTEVEITGWQFTLFGTVGFDTVQIPHTTTPWCGVVDPDTFHVMEASTVPPPTWVHTTPTSVDITLLAGQSGEVDFGNVCLGAGKALTLGFWSNKNGQSLEIVADFTLLTFLNLVNADGSPKNFTGTLTQNKDALNVWLLSATATNMAYMLSAQLATMELNTTHNSPKYGVNVNPNALVYAPALLNPAFPPTAGLNALGFITVASLMTAANTILLPPGNLTVGASTLRSYEEALKTALDSANNNLTFTQSAPCDFHFGD